MMVHVAPKRNALILTIIVKCESVSILVMKFDGRIHCLQLLWFGLLNLTFVLIGIFSADH